jgi:putative inorganic carbon (HCO3(-)) transporter
MQADLAHYSKSLKHLSYLVAYAAGCILLGATLAIHDESLIVILLGLAIVGFLVFMSMDFTLYAMLICLPFSFRYILPAEAEVQTPTEPLLGMLVFAFLIRKVVDRAIRPKQHESDDVTGERFPFRVPLCFFIFVHFLPTFNAPQFFVSVKGAFRAVVYIMSSFLAYELIKNRRDLRMLFVAAFPSASIAVVWTAIVLIYNIDQWQWTTAYRGSPFTNYSVYGSFTAIFFLIVLSRLLLDRTPYDRVLWSGLLIIFSVGLMMCFSRGVWLSVVVSVVFLLMQTGEQHKKILFVVLIGGLVIFIFALPGVSDLILNRISTAFSLQFASNQSRLLRWGQAFIMFLQSPIIGNGYGAFAMTYEPSISLIGEFVAQYRLGAHSEYLQVLAELGIVGFAAWVWVIVAFFRFGLRAVPHIEDGFYRFIIVGLMAAELSLLVHFIVNNLLNGDRIGVPFWLIYGLLPAVVNIAKREKPL